MVVEEELAAGDTLEGAVPVGAEVVVQDVVELMGTDVVL